ncbi:hypothetical protein JKF63_07629 [Porcisia hertigi]|uniref:Uncharacterized protein n=1 Tax=Porcisia hertigi TaxID=2761500 RepID=A0A836IF95_9TRYP|nr:hypothetical protein JKF63_07629 [Porcisia hertigi]
MLRLRGAGGVTRAAASAALPRMAPLSSASSLPGVFVVAKTTAVVFLSGAPSMTWTPSLISNRQFYFSSVRLRAHPVSCSATSTFLRSARLPTPSPLSLDATQYRWIRVKGQQQQQQEEGGSTAGESGRADGESSAKSDHGDEPGDSSAKGNTKEKNSGGKTGRSKKSFMDHVRGLRSDFSSFPQIYNSVNAINFIVFTIFCLCSTGSNTEERWWLNTGGVDNSVRPWTWLLHSFLTNNFLAMTYGMILLHTMCHHVLPILGSRGLMMYCGGTAVISGAMMWLGNYFYYGSEAAPEKQFGPWDIISALFVMEYCYYGLTPMTILNSFSGWIKYACWVGQACIFYFDWQPTLAGTLVGLALCKGVPRFKSVKPKTGAV